ncbi:MAG: choice-of-anchor J domain-containing protein [Prevotellaceae bacterium]|nr:choice-of-anchor J domain-containing protein [Prevotellaceae bacterium]
MKKHILWAIAISLGVASCIAEKGDPQQPASGLTRLHETFEALSDENSITRLNGWANIMVVDTAYTAPLQWLAYETGCNMAAQASAHMFDNSNSGIRYETWLLTPPLDFSNAANKELSFKLQATHWNDNTTLDVFLVPDLSAIKSDQKKLVPLKATLPTSTGANRWLKTTLNMGGTQGVAMLGFRYRGVGGNSASTSFLVDDVIFGDVSALPNVFIFEESFAESLGRFTPVSKSGVQEWEWNGNATSAPYVNAAKISGYSSGSSTPNEDWLISPPIDLSGVQSATLTFEQNINKGTPSAEVMRQEQAVLVSTTCTDSSKPDNAAWEPLAVTRYPSGTSWSFACSGKVSLTPYAGSSNVRIAFRYTCGSSNAATWSLANVKVAK